MHVVSVDPIAMTVLLTGAEVTRVGCVESTCVAVEVVAVRFPGSPPFDWHGSIENGF